MKKTWRDRGVITFGQLLAILHTLDIKIESARFRRVWQLWRGVTTSLPRIL